MFDVSLVLVGEKCEKGLGGICCGGGNRSWAGSFREPAELGPGYGYGDIPLTLGGNSGGFTPRVCIDGSTWLLPSGEVAGFDCGGEWSDWRAGRETLSSGECLTEESVYGGDNASRSSDGRLVLGAEMAAEIEGKRGRLGEVNSVLTDGAGGGRVTGTGFGGGRVLDPASKESLLSRSWSTAALAVVSNSGFAFLLSTGLESRGAGGQSCPSGCSLS